MFLSSERQSRKFIKLSLILKVNLKGEKNQKQLNIKHDGQRTENVQNIQDTSLCPQSGNNPNKCPSIGRYVLYYIHKTEYYSTIKRNKGLIHVTAWMNLKDIMINETNWM